MRKVFSALLPLLVIVFCSLWMIFNNIDLLKMAPNVFSRLVTILLKISISILIIRNLYKFLNKYSKEIIGFIFGENYKDKENKKYKEETQFMEFVEKSVVQTLTGVGAAFIISGISGLRLGNNYFTFEPDKDMRTTFLALIVGSLTFLTFTENRRRNDIASSKNDWDKQQTIRMNRRDRYISLVDKLSNESSAVRLGAVHALVLLADEWVDERSKEKNKEESDNILDREHEGLKGSDIAHKEAQNIVRVLCAYLREPSELANKKYVNKEYLSDIDQKKLSAEIVIRKTLVNTYFKKRLTPSSETGKGSWSDLYFHFSNVTFFYGIDLSECLWERNVSFKSAVFYEKATFSNAICKGEKGMNFRMCTHHKISALDVVNSSNADFSKSVYGGKVIFNKNMNSSKNIKDILVFTKWNNKLPDCCFDKENNIHSFIHQMDDDSLNEFKAHPKNFRDNFLKNIE